MGDHEKAEEMFYMARQISDKCPICYNHLGLSLLARGEYRKALFCFRTVLDLREDYPQVNYRVAQCYWRMEELQNAREAFMEELRNDPKNIDAILEFGRLLIELGEIEAGREKFHRVIEFEPDNMTARLELGDLAMKEGQFSEAVNFYLSVLEKRPYYMQVRRQLAQGYEALSRWDLAREQLELILELDEEQPDLLSELAEVCVKDKDPHAGQAYLEELLKMDPRSAGDITQPCRVPFPAKQLAARHRLLP